jgi:hypothetical protein
MVFITPFRISQSGSLLRLRRPAFHDRSTTSKVHIRNGLDVLAFVSHGSDTPYIDSHLHA